jgi:O-antigen/teichoic acid export membrane protein
MRGYIYPLLIARFLSPVSVTLFSLPVKLMAFPTDGVGTMTEILNPLSSRLEAKNDFARLRELILNASQTAFLLLVPLGGLLIVFGREILTFWVGPQYAGAYSILVLLTLGLGAAATQCCMQSMLFGIERHKALVWYRLGEGLTVVIVGSAALKIWGLVGYASVIAATLLATSLFFVPRHLCKIIGLPLRKYLSEGCLKACVVAAPAIACFAAIHHAFVISSWIELLAAAFFGGVVFALTLIALTIIGWRSPKSLYRLSILQLIAEKLAPMFSSRLRPASSLYSAD